MTELNSADTVSFTIDGETLSGYAGEPLIDCLERHDHYLPHLCYHPGLGPLQTCDTCLVLSDGELRHGCSLRVSDALAIDTRTEKARAARGEAIDRVVAKH